ncbi:MAG: DUF285 domain-containing protein [Proteobacteria bacterium]|nr:DUF285 domain-containing protein [Pseudomonadota bacterium]
MTALPSLNRSLVIALVAFLTSCNMEDIVHYGDPCEGWENIYSGGESICSAGNLSECRNEYIQAYQANRCPLKYEKCTFITPKGKRQKVCMANCTSTVHSKLCNGECITPEKYATAHIMPTEDAEYCTLSDPGDPGDSGDPGLACPPECAETCLEDGNCPVEEPPDAQCAEITCESENEHCVEGACVDWCEGITCETEGEHCVRGRCVDACNGTCTGENMQCRDGSCIDVCAEITCEATEYCALGTCKPIDANRNHLHDRYETSPRQGEACTFYRDCDTEPDKGDGFCDSFLDYKCSTKCTSDEQCVSDPDYHYVCRPDGRCAPDVFVSVWKIPSNSKTLTLPTDHAKTCQFTIEWGDGKTDTVTTCEPALQHQYYDSGTYTVILKGTFDSFGWPLKESGGDDTPDTSASKLIEIKAFGPIGLAPACFANTKVTKLSPIDIPDATKLTSLNQFFMNATEFNQPLEHWDISFATGMIQTFKNAKLFNQPLEKWRTHKITSMRNLFSYATSFNQPLATWDTSNVTDMSNMFEHADSFDQDLNGWDTSNVTDMSYMFFYITHFNRPLDKWHTSKVTNMSHMFLNTSFNQPLDTWDTSNVTDMSGMFQYINTFNQPLNMWNTSNVTNLSGMFRGTTSFNQPLDRWNTSKVTNISYMFNGASSFNQDISMWDISQVKSHYNLNDYTQDEYYRKVLNGSGLSQDNYCKLAKISDWYKVLSGSGFNYTCN